MITAAKISLASFIMAFSATNTYSTVVYPDPNIFSGVIQPRIAEAATRQSLTEEQVVVMVKKYATQYRVKERSMIETIKCEAPRNDDGTYDPYGQSLIIGSDGVQEKSWGLAQINFPAHPEITMAQAQDPEFSIEFMAREFVSGRAKLWTCWRTLKKNGKI